MKQTKDVILNKLDWLTQARLNEVLDFLDFLISKDSDIKRSLDDIKAGKVQLIETANDLNDYFSKLDIWN